MKRNKRKLQLNKLTVANLSARDLVAVQGGWLNNDGGGGGSGSDDPPPPPPTSQSLGSKGCQTGLCVH